MDRVLIIAAHPDDDILGCGGYISKFSKEKDFRVIFIAEGSSCRYDNNVEKEVIEEIEKRNGYGVRALNSLGVDNIKFYNLRCGSLDQVPILTINKIIENEINTYKPNIVFTHSNRDTNNDHLIVNKSTLIATRPGAKFFIPTLMTYEILSSSEWKFTESFKPNYFETLTKTDVQNKWNALSEYESEIKDFPYPRSEEGIRTLAQYRGMQCNRHFAEAFEIIRQIN